MKRFLWVAVAALALAVVEPVPARGAPDGREAAPKKHTPPRTAKPPRVYGTPIQPPIVKKRAGKRTTAHGASTKQSAAKHKAANAAAARRAKADLEARRAHPASADGPR